jgi:hypothetical protein
MTVSRIAVVLTCRMHGHQFDGPCSKSISADATCNRNVDDWRGWRRVWCRFVGRIECLRRCDQQRAKSLDDRSSGCGGWGRGRIPDRQGASSQLGALCTSLGCRISDR